jgi:hypothetical protein
MMQLMGISSGGDLGNVGVGRYGGEEWVVVWRRESWVD